MAARSAIGQRSVLAQSSHRLFFALPRPFVFAPERAAPEVNRGQEELPLVGLVELAKLAEMNDEEAAAALQRISSPQQGMLVCSPAQQAYPGLARPRAIPATIRQMAVAPQLALSLQERFDAHVMCDYTPTRPNYLPKVQWVSYKVLYGLAHRRATKYGAMEVWYLGPGNLKQLITQWYKNHPAFAGLGESAWIKQAKNDDPRAPSGSQVTKFSFKYTPR